MFIIKIYINPKIANSFLPYCTRRAYNGEHKSHIGINHVGRTNRKTNNFVGKNTIIEKKINVEIKTDNNNETWLAINNDAGFVTDVGRF